MIYSPEKDSYLMKEALEDFLPKKNKSLSILDMGSGSGILANACMDLGFKDILCIDLNPEAVQNLKKQGLNAIESNLFQNLLTKTMFDLIIFNPPYLPLDSREPLDSQLATTGGKKGNEIILEFLKESNNHLNSGGHILLLFSTLSKPKTILNTAKKLGYTYSLLKTQKIPYEELFVYIFSRNQ
jgi:release factor glutamine methyltransferase